MWGPSGGDPGVSTNLLFNPENKTGIIVFMNSDQADVFEITKKIYMSIIK